MQTFLNVAQLRLKVAKPWYDIISTLFVAPLIKKLNDINRCLTDV